MGRTQHTYRMRLQKIRDHLIRMVKEPRLREIYKEMWVSAHNLSAPGSTFPYPDTHGIATYSMLLESIKRIEDLKSKISKIDDNK